MTDMEMGAPGGAEPSALTAELHDPCCTAHGVAMDCMRYRCTHIVKPGEDCCPTWAAKEDKTFVPSGCPAGFSSSCCYWTSNGICRCWSPPLAAQPPSSGASIKDSEAAAFGRGDEA